MKFVIVDMHPEGGAPLTSPASLAVICAFATKYEVARLMALKVGEIYVHQPEAARGIRRVE